MRQLSTLLVGLYLSGAVPAQAGVVKMDPLDVTRPVAMTESAALFVGIRTFLEDETLTEVQYAVDDAIDLAHLFTIERPLVRPERAVLALSGEPQKKKSRERLAALIANKIRIEQARHADLLKLLRAQAAQVGENGIFIAAFATHGINDRGTQHLLTASSLLDDLETSLTETKLRDILVRYKVPRALVFIDACRERLTNDVRAGGVSARSAAAKLLDELGKVTGHVVFSAAAPDQYAYDHDGNGVFTAAVLEGLRCRAATDPDGFVTVGALHRYVEDRVLSWIQKNRARDARHATQLSVDGRASLMPVAVCPTLSGRE